MTKAIERRVADLERRYAIGNDQQALLRRMSDADLERMIVLKTRQIELKTKQCDAELSAAEQGEMDDILNRYRR